MNPNAKNLQNEVVVQMTDIVSYSSRTADMTPGEIRDFILDYHKRLSALVKNWPEGADIYTPLPGDSSVSLYTDTESSLDKSVRAIRTAIRAALAVEAGRITPTRMGLFTGEIIEADFNGIPLSFGNSFAAAARLEQLCGYFGIHFLFDRELARSDKDQAGYITSIGKITPKNFKHPIHAYTVYKPGFHGCPRDIDTERLQSFICLKNDAMDYFSGNALKDIVCDYSVARKKLEHAQTVFFGLTGKTDPATARILDYIREHPDPTREFLQYGMRLGLTSAPNSVNTAASGVVCLEHPDNHMYAPTGSPENYSNTYPSNGNPWKVNSAA